MKRFIIIIYFAACLTICGYAISPFEIEPQLKIDENGVIVFIASDMDLGRARLFWTAEKLPQSENPNLFPHYPFFVQSSTLGKLHSLQLPFRSAKRDVFDADLPFDQLVRFRIDAIAKTKDSFINLNSKEYRFKVIKRQDGKPAFGMIFSDAPSVAMTTQNSAFICWETNFPSKAIIEYGRKGKTKREIIESDAPVRRSLVNIEDLKPNTIYEYKIRCIDPKNNDEIISPIYTFRTAPKKGGAFRFAIMSNSRGNSRHPNPDFNINGVNAVMLNKLSTQAYAQGAEFIMFVGNLVAGYTDDPGSAYLQYKTWKEAVAPVHAHIPIFAAMGDHDATAPRPRRIPGKDDLFAEDVWRSALPMPSNGPTSGPGLPPYLGNVYYFTYGGAFFGVLNSAYYFVKQPTAREAGSAATIDEIQRKWFHSALESNKKAKLHFAFWNAPAFPCSLYYGNSLDRLPEVRDAVLNILDAYNVDVIFNGREHNYSRLLINESFKPGMKGGIWQINTGGAGAPPHPPNPEIPWARFINAFKSDYHWILCEVCGRNAHFWVFNENGRVIDEFKIKGKKK
ncbi:MAG TPA: metallophosphoesterase family protein [Candidatus Sumerlaeota bacterium]|nr:metallophosphoesterase family protein [Candidatus Sumerlaeota bacterium]HON50702.1 metallophosphoesterase family protein [Candidatus Sumerlaeota bacterium]HOR65180.1 metallophosphoesterase family protein [Candidatus Sumerlaeota bacterium]HPL75135.1 metallophosphoesterase family protein [Candidatus Sumerlaeota bacterium]HRU53008.1 metallophosphoesterase family protein [Candidatus Sumerlaeia bacterium]